MEGDLVYMSTKNLTYPKGLARKLIPKFVGPYLILRDYGNHSFHVNLPAIMRQCRIHDVFHASSLCIHHPNDDRLFPGQLDEQVVEPEQHPHKWTANKILNHAGTKSNLLFKVLWKSGNKTWLLQPQVEDLNLLKPYLDIQGATTVAELPISVGQLSLHDPQIFLDGSKNEMKIDSKISRPTAIKGGRGASLNSIAVYCLSPPARITVSPIHSHLSHPLPSMGCRLRSEKGLNPPNKDNKHHPLHHYKTPSNISFQASDGMIILVNINSRSVGKDPFYGDHNPVPVGYADCVDMFNRHPTYPCKLVTWDNKRQGFFSPYYSIPLTVIQFKSVDKRYQSFLDVGLLCPNRDVNQQCWQTVLLAILRPHSQSERNCERGKEKHLRAELQQARKEDLLPSHLCAPPKKQCKKRMDQTSGPATDMSSPIPPSYRRHSHYFPYPRGKQGQGAAPRACNYPRQSQRQGSTSAINSASILFTPLSPRVVPVAGSSQTTSTVDSIGDKDSAPAAGHVDLEDMFEGLSNFDGEASDHPEDQDMHDLDHELDPAAN
ncbi:hypothetical protein C0989_003508 [Termitomyces sp. Mn162]|nr:hypothetical protein C0989_003508 [Termitomyces sp. Mn162]